MTKLFLAGTSSNAKLNYSKYVLESFYYIKSWQLDYIHKWDMFLLDSGAFTFMNSAKGEVDLNEYLNDYIEFINKNHIKYFFELDIDAIVGLEKVEQIRRKIEFKTRKKVIPVWHKSRGIEKYYEICREYDYIAIGGLAMKNIKRKEYPYLKQLTRIAKEHNTKVHGLGFTTKDFMKYGFYSVDSTSWQGGRFGKVYRLVNGGMKSYNYPNRRLVDSKKAQLHNFNEWVKYQNYVERF